jgi:hypothetical protein
MVKRTEPWNINFFSISLTIVLLFFIDIHATVFQPWLGNYLEFEWSTTAKYQHYDKLSKGANSQKYNSTAYFLQTSLSNAINPQFSVELETVFAHTKKQKNTIDHFKATGRYVWLDDIRGDFLTVTTGLSLIKAFRHSLKDVSSFHHGLGEAELFLSLGKEFSIGTNWDSRWWALTGIGIAEKGSPWLRFIAAYEKRWDKVHEFAGTLCSLWGLGHHSLKLYHFRGYGPIQHQSVDLSLRYTYLIQYVGHLSVEYTYRIHGRNFPISLHSLWVHFLYTFGL